MGNQKLTERAEYLLKVLIENYVQKGQPVSSRALAQEAGLDLSPASIRNIMADLEDRGLLLSPHTSAGRIPTVSGYRLFVDSMLKVQRLDERSVERIRTELDPEQGAQALLERTSRLLSDVSQFAGVVMMPKAREQSLRQIEFLPLSDNKVLVIMVLNEREVQNRVIQTSRGFSPAELQQAANYLNQVCAGRGMRAARERLLGEMRDAREGMNRLMIDAIEMAQVLFEEEEGEDYLLAGQTNLMDIAELSDMEKLRQLFETFNEKRDILHLLDQALGARGLQIFIGEESGYDVLGGCSVVTAPYEADGEVLGVLGVIGPTRMAYDRVISIVDLTARMLGSALKHHP